MEEKLVTLAILTYAKAQILKNVLENEGIETYIHKQIRNPNCLSINWDSFITFFS